MSHDAQLSLFHKLVTKEDDYTQLLRNLMVRCDDFREAMLSLFFPDERLISQVGAEHVRTQILHAGYGRPDLVINSPALFMLIEVKISEWRGLTTYQAPVELTVKDAKHYYALAAKSAAPNRGVFFLVPDGWRSRQDTLEMLERQSSRVFHEDGHSLVEPGAKCGEQAPLHSSWR